MPTRDVVVCGTHLEGERIAFSAPLGSRSELEQLLRELAAHPDVRHLVLAGDDRKATGDALVVLWKQGLDEDGRLAGPRGRLSPELGATPVDALRSDVQISDLREKPQGDLAASIRDLPFRSGERTGLRLTAPEIPERKVFLSRKTSFPIFTSSVADGWLQLLNLALRIGSERESAPGERAAVALNALVTVETPVLENGEKEARDEFPAFLDFTRDDFERCFLPGARDANLASADFEIVEDKLFASYVLQRCDVYTDWPLEATALVRRHREEARRLGVEAGTATFLLQRVVLPARDFARSWRVLGDWFKRPLPLHVDPSGVFLFGNDGGKARAMLLNHDASDIQWEDAFSDPEDLSWYIVDVMPWLLPQHIRYVGQECAALMRCMREGECYLQG